MKDEIKETKPISQTKLERLKNLEKKAHKEKDEKRIKVPMDFIVIFCFNFMFNLSLYFFETGVLHFRINMLNANLLWSQINSLSYNNQKH